MVIDLDDHDPLSIEILYKQQHHNVLYDGDRR